MSRRWNPSMHPRWPHNGQFRPRFSQSVRISPLSATWNGGVRVPIIPGRVNVYVGALARVENAAGQRALHRLTDRAVDRALGKRAGGAIAKVIKGRDVSIGGARVSRSRVLSAPTVRVNKRAPERYYAPGGKTYTTRRPRAPRAPRTRAVSMAGARVR